MGHCPLVVDVHLPALSGSAGDEARRHWASNSRGLRQRFTDSTYFIALASVRDPDLVPTDNEAMPLRIQGQGQPRSPIY